MTNPDWTEIEAHGERIRYHEREGDGRSGYRVQYWHVSLQEWRDVVSVSSRDWFAIGVEVGKRMREEQTEMFA